MDVTIEPDSIKKANGLWTPAANVYIYHNKTTYDDRYYWINKEVQGKEEANFIAKFLAKRYLIKEKLLEPKSN